MKVISMDTKYPYCNPEMWGGIECTINRVDDNFTGSTTPVRVIMTGG